MTLHRLTYLTLVAPLLFVIIVVTILVLLPLLALVLTIDMLKEALC